MVRLALLKWSLVLGLLILGVWSLLTGLGVEVPLIKFKGLEAQGMPAGAVILAVAVALAYFWKISVRRKEETVETTGDESGGSFHKVERTKETVTTFKVPGDP